MPRSRGSVMVADSMSTPELSLEELAAAGPMDPIPDPYSLYARLRRESPVATMPGSGGVMVTRYEDVRNTLKRNDVFVNALLQRTMGIVMGPTIIGMDGPEHTKHRNLITPALAPRALRGDFPERVERIAHEIINGFASKRCADIRAEFTFSYPLTVFVDILGLPAKDVEHFHRWGIDLTLVAHDPTKGIAASGKMLDYLAPIVHDKRINPSSDLISRLATAEVDGHRLSDLEVISFLRLLVLAGAETTYHLLGTTFYCLLKDPDLMDRVVCDRTLVPALLQEALRWDSPIAAVVREASEDTEIAGVTIEQGTQVLCHIGSANRDERRFDHPDAFDIDRVNPDSIAFGLGKHFCAGSKFALLEAEIGVNAILDRLPNLRLRPGEAPRIIGVSFRGPDHLPVDFDA
jgi:cytochrome P450